MFSYNTVYITYIFGYHSAYTKKTFKGNIRSAESSKYSLKKDWNNKCIINAVNVSLRRKKMISMNFFFFYSS